MRQTRAAEQSGASSLDSVVATELVRLEALDLGALRVAYRNHTGRIAPVRISRSVLVKVLAYRIQAERFGDLKPETRRLLDRIGVTSGTGPGSTGPAAVPGRPRPKPGTVLVREWQGRMQHVTVLADGFTWNGASYPSLSAVAQAITGTKWNGRRFFGLPSLGTAPAERSRSSSEMSGPSPASTVGGLAPVQSGGEP